MKKTDYMVRVCENCLCSSCWIERLKKVNARLERMIRDAVRDSDQYAMFINENKLVERFREWKAMCERQRNGTATEEDKRAAAVAVDLYK